MRKILFFIVFFLPFVFWLWLITQENFLIVLFNDPLLNRYLIISSQNLWPIFLTFFIFQIGNFILAKILSFYKIFDKINYVFIFLHYLVVFWIFYFNFF